MKPIFNVIKDLSLLAALDADKRRTVAKSAPYEKLSLEGRVVRERLPTAVLIHYDSRHSRGKEGAVRVSNGTCGGCHLALPYGQLNDLRQADVAVQVCESCGVFLLPEVLSLSAQMVTPKQISVQPRKRKIKVTT